MMSAGSERPITTLRLDGGRPCLDFVNTIHDRMAVTPEDYLATPERFAAWCVYAHLLDGQEAGQVRVGPRAMRQIRLFRELLHALFTARIAGRPEPPQAIAELDRWLHRAWNGLELDLGSPQCLSWSKHAVDAYLPVKRIALSALDVLRDPESRRLRQCASRGSCGWLFFDDTKNRRRRWCAMETCGTAAKMRIYRAR
jgi:predicted RNA-binding Zn ribbon-like protein